MTKSTLATTLKATLVSLTLFGLTISGCKKNSEVDKLITNNPPDQFSVSVIKVSSDSAVINWTQSTDPDGDPVTYKILINDTIKITNYTGVDYVFKNLHELTTYNIKIIAVDSKQNETSESLTLTTKKYWLTFLKKVEYGSISGYSSQKCGQMIKANDGNGYVIVGESEIPGGTAGPYRMFAIKIDTLGNKLWQKYYDYTVGNTIEIKIIKNTNDGYIISGGSNLISINNAGDLIWHQSTSTTFNVIFGIAINSAGQIYTVGDISFDSATNKMAAILSKYDADGNLQWNKQYSPSIYDQFYDIKIDANDQLIVLGLTEGTNMSIADYNYGGQSRFDFWVLKLTEDGDIVWSNTYPIDYNQAFPENIIQTKEGNYVFTGFTFGPYDITYFHLQMIDGGGNSMWSYFSEENHTKSYSVSETSDNSLIVAGGFQLPNSMQSALFKFDKNGNVIWEKLYPEFATFLQNRTVLPTSDGGYIINCQKSKPYNSSGETDQIYIFKTTDTGEFSN